VADRHASPIDRNPVKHIVPLHHRGLDRHACQLASSRQRQVELVGRDARVDVHEQPHPASGVTVQSVSSVFGRQSRYLEKRVADRHASPIDPSSFLRDFSIVSYTSAAVGGAGRIAGPSFLNASKKHAMITVSQWGDSPEREFGFRAPKSLS
jgi:hypothetical protein